MIIVSTADPLVVSGTWTVVVSDELRDKALSIARGVYQRSIVRGSESASGSTLRGKAKRYGKRYKASYANFLARLRNAGIEVNEVLVGPRRRRVTVLGSFPERWRAADTVSCVSGMDCKV